MRLSGASGPDGAKECEEKIRALVAAIVNVGAHNRSGKAELVAKLNEAKSELAPVCDDRVLPPGFAGGEAGDHRAAGAEGEGTEEEEEEEGENARLWRACPLFPAMGYSKKPTPQVNGP